jgi:hypothetical protein
MEYYSGKEPNLVGTAFTNTVNKIMKKKTNSTISDNISTNITEFYNNYISEHVFLILLITLFIIFLVYRYYYIQHKKKDDDKESEFEKELFGGQDNNIIDDITHTQTQHLKYDQQPSFNPLYPVNQQKERVYYPPDPLPINIPSGNGLTYTRNIYAEPKDYSPLNSSNYDYFNVYTNPTRSYYSGTYNTYVNAPDTDMINPLGFATDFNNSTGTFINGMTDANKRTVLDLQQIVDQTNNNLTDSLKYGPTIIKSTSSVYGLDPPYADD